jgi:hypothetical protein
MALVLNRMSVVSVVAMVLLKATAIATVVHWTLWAFVVEHARRMIMIMASVMILKLWVAPILQRATTVPAPQKMMGLVTSVLAAK